MKIILARIRLVVNVLFVVVFSQSFDAWALVGAVNDSYNGAEIQTPDSLVLTEGSAYLFEWEARPAPGKTAITLFSFFDQSSPWSEITFELFGGGSNGSSAAFQTQYMTEGGNQHLEQHSSPNVFDGGYHTFGIVYRPSGGGTSALIEWYVDGNLIRKVSGGDADQLDNTMRLHAAVWKVHNNGGWGSAGTTGLADRTAVSVRHISRSIRKNNSWDEETLWRFTNNSSLSPWTLSDWTFSGFDGRYTPENAKIVNGTLQLVLSRQGYSNSPCTVTDGIYYALENLNSGKFLDVTDYGKTNGSKLQQYGDVATRDNRIFKADFAGSGYWGYQNTGSGLYLDIQGGTSAVENNRLLQLWGGGADPTNRQFDLVDGDNGGCELRPRHTIDAGETKCIGVTGASRSNGGSVVQYSCNSSADQEWNFIPR